MIFDELGLPKDNGATDLQDSSRLAGLLATFHFPTEKPLELPKYVLDSTTLGGVSIVRTLGGRPIKTYTRHPKEKIYNFSRDQAICLMAGLRTQAQEHLVNRHFIDGKDIFSPSQSGHIRICQGLKPRWYQRAWFWIDVVYNCFVNPKSEPNQLLCMMMVHPSRSYLKFWTKHNKFWKESITEYWCGWRNEKELAAHMIARVSRVVG